MHHSKLLCLLKLRSHVLAECSIVALEPQPPQATVVATLDVMQCNTWSEGIRPAEARSRQVVAHRIVIPVIFVLRLLPPDSILKLLPQGAQFLRCRWDLGSTRHGVQPDEHSIDLNIAVLTCCETHPVPIRYTQYYFYHCDQKVHSTTRYKKFATC
jgi:hypothetical protein